MGVYANLVGHGMVLAVERWGPTDNAYLGLAIGAEWALLVGNVVLVGGVARWRGLHRLAALEFGLLPLPVAFGIASVVHPDSFPAAHMFGALGLLAALGLAVGSREQTTLARAALVGALGALAIAGLFALRGPAGWLLPPFGLDLVVAMVSLGAGVFVVAGRLGRAYA